MLPNVYAYVCVDPRGQKRRGDRTYVRPRTLHAQEDQGRGPRVATYVYVRVVPPVRTVCPSSVRVPVRWSLVLSALQARVLYLGPWGSSYAGACLRGAIRRSQAVTRRPSRPYVRALLWSALWATPRDQHVPAGHAYAGFFTTSSVQSCTVLVRDALFWCTDNFSTNVRTRVTRALMAPAGRLSDTSTGARIMRARV
jgi:hypothetical protein